MEKSIYIPIHIPRLILTYEEYNKMMNIIAKETRGDNN
jgi:hypothetical protein